MNSRRVPAVVYLPVLAFFFGAGISIGLRPEPRGKQEGTQHSPSVALAIPQPTTSDDTAPPSQPATLSQARRVANNIHRVAVSRGLEAVPTQALSHPIDTPPAHMTASAPGMVPSQAPAQPLPKPVEITSLTVPSAAEVAVPLAAPLTMPASAPADLKAKPAPTPHRQVYVAPRYVPKRPAAPQAQEMPILGPLFGFKY